jgi:hypothetical protein
MVRVGVREWYEQYEQYEQMRWRSGVMGYPLGRRVPALGMPPMSAAFGLAGGEALGGKGGESGRDLGGGAVVAQEASDLAAREALVALPEGTKEAVGECLGLGGGEELAGGVVAVLPEGEGDVAGEAGEGGVGEHGLRVES